MQQGSQKNFVGTMDMRRYAMSDATYHLLILIGIVIIIVALFIPLSRRR